MDHGIAYAPTINLGQVLELTALIVTLVGMAIGGAIAFGSLRNQVHNVSLDIVDIKLEMTELRKTTVAIAGVTQMLQSHADIIKTMQREIGELRREIAFPLKPSYIHRQEPE